MIQKTHDNKAKRNGRYGEKTNKPKKNILPAPQSSKYCLSGAVLWDSGVVQLCAVASQVVCSLIFVYFLPPSRLFSLCLFPFSFSFYLLKGTQMNTVNETKHCWFLVFSSEKCSLIEILAWH